MHDMHDPGLSITWTFSLLCWLPLLTCSPSHILTKCWMEFHAAASADSQIFTINTQSAEMLVASLWIGTIGQLIFSLPSCLSRLSSSERYQSCCFSEEQGEHKGTSSPPCLVLWSIHLFRLNGACNTYHCSGSRRRCCFLARGNILCSGAQFPAPSKPRWWEGWQSCSSACPYH